MDTQSAGRRAKASGVDRREREKKRKKEKEKGREMEEWKVSGEYGQRRRFTWKPGTREREEGEAEAEGEGEGADGGEGCSEEPRKGTIRQKVDQAKSELSI